MGERCNSTSSVRTHDCVDCSSLANEDRDAIFRRSEDRAREDRKIGRSRKRRSEETRVRTQRSFKFVLGRSPTPLLLPFRHEGPAKYFNP